MKSNGWKTKSKAILNSQLIPPGYKHTEVGVIPEDWEVARLAAVCSMKSGEGITSVSIDQFSQYPCYGGNGLRGFTTRFTHNGRYALIGRQGALCGNVLGVEGRFFASEHAIVVTASARTDIRWLTFVLGEMRLNQYSESTAQPGLSVSKLLSLDVAYPPTKSEQDAIAEVLGNADALIESLEQLTAAKTEFKRGLMQQLLTGRTRFKEFEGQEWKLMKLSDFSKLSLRPTPKPGKPFKSLGIRSHGKGTFLKEDFEPEKIELTELYEVKENDLIVNITFAWEGAIAIAGAADSGALVSHRFPTYVFDTERAIPEYFRHVIVQKKFVEKLGLISPGGAGRNRVLSKKDFANLEVLMPSVEEQQKIAAVLNACDRELTLLREQLAEFKNQKQGLMQKLLTGQIRVKVNEAQAIGV